MNAPEVLEIGREAIMVMIEIGAPVMLVALDVASVERRAKLPPVEGDQADMYRRTERGEAVLASENFVRLHGGRLFETSWRCRAMEGFINCGPRPYPSK